MKRAEDLVPAKEKIAKAIEDNHNEAVQLRRLLKMREELDDLAAGKVKQKRKKESPQEKPADEAA